MGHLRPKLQDQRLYSVYFSSNMGKGLEGTAFPLHHIAPVHQGTRATNLAPVAQRKSITSFVFKHDWTSPSWQMVIASLVKGREIETHQVQFLFFGY